MILDSSALLAVYFQEPLGPQVVSLMQGATQMYMSTVTLCEVLIRVRDRQPADAAKIESDLMSSTIQFYSPDPSIASVAAQARHLFSINLGDCFVYALAKSLRQPILTLDADFKRTDAVIVPI